jgi:hypothetical protein
VSIVNLSRLAGAGVVVALAATASAGEPMGQRGEQRAYVVRYAAEDILNWQTARINGRNVVTLVALRELVESLGPLPPASVPDSTVCRLSIPLHSNCASSVSVPLHFEVVKADETGKVPADAPNEFQKIGRWRCHLVAALLARLEPSLRFRFSLIALGRWTDPKHREASPGARHQH